MPDSTPTCPDCGAALSLGASGERTFWSCPAGHGLGFTMTAACARVDDDAIGRAWRASEDAPTGTRACPFCGRTMVSATFAAGTDAGDLTVDVCGEDELFWLAPGELDQLPPAHARAEPSAEELRNLAVVRRAFDAGIDEAIRQEQGHGILDRLADTVVRRHPGFVSMVDRGTDGHELDDLPALEARVEREDGTSSEAAT
jgi:Zn-finger nucleic acid-binding protein